MHKLTVHLAYRDTSGSCLFGQSLLSEDELLPTALPSVAMSKPKYILHVLLSPYTSIAGIFLPSHNLSVLLHEIPSDTRGHCLCLRKSWRLTKLTGTSLSRSVEMVSQLYSPWLLSQQVLSRVVHADWARLAPYSYSTYSTGVSSQIRLWKLFICLEKRVFSNLASLSQISGKQGLPGNRLRWISWNLRFCRQCSRTRSITRKQDLYDLISSFPLSAGVLQWQKCL